MSTGELAKALAAARGVMRGTVHKGGTNAHQRYPYVGHEHVMTSGAREALQDNGLSLVQTAVEFVGEVPGGKTQVLLWRGAFRLLHASGENVELSYLATTQANDKSAFVASTSLDRTAFLRVLALAGSTEDDPEHDTHDRQAQAQAQQPMTQQGAADAATRAAQSATAHERERAAVSAALSVLTQKLRNPHNNSRATVDPLREEASKLKPRLLERQIEELAVDIRAALTRVHEAEEAERALHAQNQQEGGVA